MRGVCVCGNLFFIFAALVFAFFFGNNLIVSKYPLDATTKYTHVDRSEGRGKSIRLCKTHIYIYL